MHTKTGLHSDEEIITYLEMSSPADLLWPRRSAPDFDFELMSPPDPELHRALYIRVGSAWQWTDRLSWSFAEWQARSHDAHVAVWVARVADEPIGFVELDFADDGNVEITYFGLTPNWIGAGYGGAVLAAGVNKAWREPDTRRVWLHTCNFDHPNALANYKARGFRITCVRHGPE
ncbi:GNAT family N-acetyltransferase [Salinisphaera sp.]|uniref:GNAT family N-acetyltransferase n=1 Tax=Salinisphaera sp. TaxID=1914330 RepID=UPI002D78C094|nr:GNAT family N-acetyltransferase [Salinisphaera sp.]HET7314879.1 GNAT family N-acetyltransferase [Salinisphaera sp.]